MSGYCIVALEKKETRIKSHSHFPKRILFRICNFLLYLLSLQGDRLIFLIKVFNLWFLNYNEWEDIIPMNYLISKWLLKLSRILLLNSRKLSPMLAGDVTPATKSGNPRRKIPVCRIHYDVCRMSDRRQTNNLIWATATASCDCSRMTFVCSV